MRALGCEVIAANGFGCDGKLLRNPQRGVLVEPLGNSRSARRPSWPRPYATRNSRDYIPPCAERPGRGRYADLRPLLGKVFAPHRARRGLALGGARSPRRRQRCGLRVFVLPPRSSKPNGAVERARCTYTEEFYEVRPFSGWSVDGVNREAQTWDRVYNTVHLPPGAGLYLRRGIFRATTAVQLQLRGLTRIRAL